MVIDALVAPFQVLVRQRPVITTFVQREIRTRYGSSALGLAWPLIRPLSLLALYTFVFSTVMKVRFGDDPRTANVFDPSIRGKTSQFMLRFRKPV